MMLWSHSLRILSSYSHLTLTLLPSSPPPNAGKYHQHLHEELNMEQSALEFMMEYFQKPVEDMRRAVG